MREGQGAIRGAREEVPGSSLAWQVLQGRSARLFVGGGASPTPCACDEICAPTWATPLLRPVGTDELSRESALQAPKGRKHKAWGVSPRKETPQIQKPRR